MTKARTMSRRATLALAASIVVLAAFASRAGAAVYGFESLTGDGQASSLFLDVSTRDGGLTATFTFSSSVADGSAVTAIYWDWDPAKHSLGRATGLVESAGVHYLDNKGGWSSANPRNLPGGRTIGFTADYGLDPRNKGGKSGNGIGSGEWLEVGWTLSGITFDQLVAGLNSGDIRVGLHVQSAGLEGKDSFSAVTTHTPLPGAVWLLGTGLLGLLGVRLRRS